MTTMAITLATDLVASLFRSPIEQRRDGEDLVLSVRGCAVFTNLRGLTKILQCLDAEIRRVIIDFESCAVIDHTTQNRLQLIADEWDGRTLELRGLAIHRAASKHVHAARWRRP